MHNSATAAPLGGSAPEPRHCRLYMAAETGDFQRFARMRKKGWDDGPIRILLSYHYGRTLDLDEHLGPVAAVGGVDVFVDSGGFSAFTLGSEINIDEYMGWCRKWKHWITTAAALDKIGDATESDKNANRMIKELAGEVKVIPTFHVGSDWSALQRWTTQVDHLALGGMVPYSARPKLVAAWLNKAFSIIPDTVKVHGFGHTIWGNLKRFPFHSVDSSSWTSPWRFGTISLFDRSKGKFVQIDPRKPGAIQKHLKLIWQYDLALKDMTDIVRRVGPNGEVLVKKDLKLRLVASQVKSWRVAEEWLGKYKDRHGSNRSQT